MMSRISRSMLAVSVFALAFVVNPLYFTGCTSSESEPNFGEAEMIALLNTSIDSAPWAFESDWLNYELSVSLSQAVQMARHTPYVGTSLTQSAFACGNRTFYQSASACVTVTELPVIGTFTLNRVDGTERVAIVSNVAVTGALVVYGDTIGGGELRLTFGDGNSLSVDNYTADDSFRLSRVQADNLGESMLDIDFSAN